MSFLLPLAFFIKIMFVIEAVFIPEQITEYRFGVLSEITDKFNTKLNVFNYMIFAVLG